MIGHFHRATSPQRACWWGKAASRAAAGLAGGAHDVVSTLGPWEAWSTLALVLAEFGCEVTVQLSDPHRRTLDATQELAFARLMIEEMTVQLHPRRPRD